jgi:hypothetical protein
MGRTRIVLAHNELVVDDRQVRMDRVRAVGRDA